jgi:hypothetical protein
MRPLPNGGEAGCRPPPAMRRPVAVPPRPGRRSFAERPPRPGPGPQPTDVDVQGGGERFVRALILLLLLLLVLFLFGQM